MKKYRFFTAAISLGLCTTMLASCDLSDIADKYIKMEGNMPEGLESILTDTDIDISDITTPTLTDPVLVETVKGKHAPELYADFVSAVENASTCKMVLSMTEMDGESVTNKTTGMTWAYGHMDVTVSKNGTTKMTLNYSSDYIYTVENGEKKKYKWAEPANILGEDPRWVHKYHGYLDLGEIIDKDTEIYSHDGEYYFTLHLTGKQAEGLKLDNEKCTLTFYFDKDGVFVRTCAEQEHYNETISMTDVNSKLQITPPADKSEYKDCTGTNPGLDNDIDDYNIYLKIVERIKRAETYSLETVKTVENIHTYEKTKEELVGYSVDKSGAQMLWYPQGATNAAKVKHIIVDGESVYEGGVSGFRETQMTEAIRADIKWARDIKDSIQIYERGDMFHISVTQSTANVYSVRICLWTSEGGALEYTLTANKEMTDITVSVMEHSPRTPDITVTYTYSYKHINDQSFENTFAIEFTSMGNGETVVDAPVAVG